MPGLVPLDVLFENFQLLHIPGASRISLQMYCIQYTVYNKVNSIALSRLDCSVPNCSVVNTSNSTESAYRTSFFKSD